MADSIDLVRLAIGDTDVDDLIFSDDEITTILDIQPIVTYAAAALADMAAAKFARQVSIGIGSTRVEAQQRFEHYKQLAKDLRSSGGGSIPGGDGSGSPTLTMNVGGISRSKRDALRENTDAIQPSFSVGQDDNPQATSDFERSRWE